MAKVKENKCSEIEVVDMLMQFLSLECALNFNDQFRATEKNTGHSNNRKKNLEKTIFLVCLSVACHQKPSMDVSLTLHDNIPRANSLRALKLILSYFLGTSYLIRNL